MFMLIMLLAHTDITTLHRNICLPRAMAALINLIGAAVLHFNFFSDCQFKLLIKNFTQKDLILHLIRLFCYKITIL